MGGFVNHLYIMCPNLDCPIITDDPTGELGPTGAVGITDNIVVGTNKADALHSVHFSQLTFLFTTTDHSSWIQIETS